MNSFKNNGLSFFDKSRWVINMLFTSRNNSVISAGRYFRRRNRPSKNDCHQHAVKRKHPVGAMIRNTWVRIHALRSCVRRVFGRKLPTFSGGSTFLKIFTGSSVTLCVMPVVSAMEVNNQPEFTREEILFHNPDLS